MIGIRRNTWLTHCLLLSLSISLIPPPVCFFTGGKAAKSPFFNILIFKMRGKYDVEEGGMKKKRGVIKET